MDLIETNENAPTTRIFLGAAICKSFKIVVVQCVIHPSPFGLVGVARMNRAAAMRTKRTTTQYHNILLFSNGNTKICPFMMYAPLSSLSQHDSAEGRRLSRCTTVLVYVVCSQEQKCERCQSRFQGITVKSRIVNTTS